LETTSRHWLPINLIFQLNQELDI